MESLRAEESRLKRTALAGRGKGGDAAEQLERDGIYTQSTSKQHHGLGRRKAWQGSTTEVFHFECAHVWYMTPTSVNAHVLMHVEARG